MMFRTGFSLWLFSILIALTNATIAIEPSSSETKSATDKTTVYRNVNEDGVVEFSDKNVTNSEKLELKPTNTFKAADKKITPAPTTTKEKSSSSQNGVTYKKISIASPAAEQQIRSNDGLLTVSVSTKPGLNSAAGDQIELFMDGRSQGKQQNTSFSLNEVFRGEHKLQAKIVNKNGDVLISSKTISIYIQKYSTINPIKSRSRAK